MLQSINKVVDAKALLALGVLAGIVSFGAITGHSQAQTTLDLEVTGGVLTLYAGDDTNNDDLCTPADDSSTVETVSCDVTERTATLSALNVASTRQNTTTTINDILFEDLQGLASSSYTVSATMCDLVDGAKSITLGANPDNEAADADGDAPTGGDENKLFATLDPSVGTVEVLRPQSAIDEYTATPSVYSVGAKTTVVDTTTSITVFTGTSVIPGRADIDGVTLKHRVPAFVEAGNYSCQTTFTIA